MDVLKTNDQQQPMHHVGPYYVFAEVIQGVYYTLTYKGLFNKL